MSMMTETMVVDSAMKKKCLVKIEGISKIFTDDATIAVDNVTLSIYEGEIFALLGGSGSGKSTLLRMLAGFELPTKGHIYLDGDSIDHLPPYLRPINMMFQSYALFPHMNVAKNIAFGLKQDHISRDEIAQRVDDMLDIVHMKKYASRKPHQLSGGQQQRVALARCLAKRPRLLLLDEPMAALDKKLRRRMQLEIVDIIEEVRVTCMMVTHDQEEAMTMADRMGIMDSGRIMQIGAPLDIYEAPNSCMVAEFIGSVNIFHGNIIAEQADHIILQTTTLEQCIYIGHGVTTAVEARCLSYAIRPEKMVMSIDKPRGLYNWAKGSVYDIAYLGAYSVYYVKLASEIIVQVSIANIERKAQNFVWEDIVYIHWEQNSGIVLNE